MSSIKKSLCSATERRGIISIIVFTVVWEICTRLHVPIIGNVPRPRPSSAPWASSLPKPSTGSRGATA